MALFETLEQLNRLQPMVTSTQGATGMMDLRGKGNDMSGLAPLGEMLRKMAMERAANMQQKASGVSSPMMTPNVPMEADPVMMAGQGAGLSYGASPFGQLISERAKSKMPGEGLALGKEKQMPRSVITMPDEEEERRRRFGRGGGADAGTQPSFGGGGMMGGGY